MVRCCIQARALLLIAMLFCAGAILDGGPNSDSTSCTNAAEVLAMRALEVSASDVIRSPFAKRMYEQRGTLCVTSAVRA
jgi:hypothetical protein